MKIETRPTDNHQITLTVTLDKTQMEGAKHRAARKISERKSIPGFRPGKAPYEVMVRSFSESLILEEAVDLLINEVYPKALDDAKIQPGAAGSVEKVDNLETEPIFVFQVPLAPVVELGNYRSVRIPYEWVMPDDKEVEKSIVELQQMYAKTEAVDRPVEYGDFVLVDVKGVKKGANESEPNVLERIGFPVFIRKDEKSDEWPYTGFSAELLGCSANGTKTIFHKFPKDLKDETLKGQTIKIDIVIKMVRGSILPELNDEFAKQVGPFEDLQALRDSMKANLSSRSKAEYDDLYFEKVLDAIKGDATIKYAPQTLDHETEHVLEEIKTRLSKQGMDLQTYLKSREIDETKFVNDEVRSAAIKRLERSLLLDEIARVEEIEVSKDILDSSFQQTFYEMAGSDEFQKYMKGKTQPPKKIVNAVALESANRAYLQQTLNRIQAIATGQHENTSEDVSKLEKTKIIKKTKARSDAPKKPGTKNTDKIKTKKDTLDEIKET